MIWDPKATPMKSVTRVWIPLKLYSLYEPCITVVHTVGQEGISRKRSCTGNVSMDSKNLANFGARNIGNEIKSLAPTEKIKCQFCYCKLVCMPMSHRDSFNPHDLVHKVFQQFLLCVTPIHC